MDEEAEVTVEDLQRELSAVKSKNEQVIGINKKLSDKLDSMESGKKELLEKMQTDEERRLIERGDFDALVQMKSQQALQAKDDAIRDYERKYESTARELEAMRIGSMARDAALTAGIRPEAQEEAMLIVRERFKMEDGQLIGRDNTGNELLNDKGAPMGISDYLQSLAQTKGYLFAKPSGGGAIGGQAAVSGVKRSDMTTEQKSAFVAKYGQDKYLSLPS